MSSQPRLSTGKLSPEEKLRRKSDRQSATQAHEMQREEISKAIKDLATEKASPQPDALRNTNGHKWQYPLLCLGKGNDFRDIGKWYTRCNNLVHNCQKRDCMYTRYLTPALLNPDLDTLERLRATHDSLLKSYGRHTADLTLIEEVKSNQNYAYMGINVNIPPPTTLPTPPQSIPGKRRRESNSPSPQDAKRSRVAYLLAELDSITQCDGPVASSSQSSMKKAAGLSPKSSKKKLAAPFSHSLEKQPIVLSSQSPIQEVIEISSDSDSSDFVYIGRELLNRRRPNPKHDSKGKGKANQ